MSGHAAPLLVFDSGFGGLTVLAEIAKRRPEADLLYVADDAAFPYGGWDAAALVERVLAVFERLVERTRPGLAVIACNTASTLVLGPLRQRFALPFVGTVPAIKPAAAATRSGLISVLATPGTVARDYTKGLIAEFAGHCEVTLVGAPRLAALAEAKLHGEAIDPAIIAAEIAPAFVEKPDGRRTDQLVLACTHYPLLKEEIAMAAPWPVALVDPAPAIARRVEALLAPADAAAPRGTARAIFTAPSENETRRARVLAGFGIEEVSVWPMPVAADRRRSAAATRIA
jgi:glutamate racemase